MALPVIVSRNQVNTIPDQAASGNPTTIGTTPFVIYTVPTGQKAILKSFVFRPTGFGAGTDMNANVASRRMRVETATSLVMLDAIAGAQLTLVAGDTVTLDGDSGSDNESAFFFISFVELPA